MSALPPDDATPWDLLAKQLADAPSAAEQAQLRAWAAGHPEREQLLASAAQTWAQARADATAHAFTDADEDAAWQRLRARLPVAAAPALTVSASNPPSSSAPPREGRAAPGQPARWQPWLRAAAAVLFLLGSAYLLRTYWPRAAAPGPDVAVATGAAKRQLALPDGSQVWLNRHSTLRYAAGFDAEHRVVQLEGEAFFAVRKAQGRPFTVLSATSRTRVLGTSFNVRAYGAEDSVEVAVETGKVSFAARGATADSVLLLPGQRGVLRQAETTPRRTATEDSNFRGWQRDELAFEQARVGHVLRTLRTTFGVRVTAADPALLHYRFTGTFPHPTPEQVLHVLSLATNSTFAQQPDGSYELTPEAR